jgi:hypothetical protein
MEPVPANIDRIKEGIEYLQAFPGPCVIKSKYSQRVSCDKGSAIFVRKYADYEQSVDCWDVGFRAERMMDFCLEDYKGSNPIEVGAECKWKDESLQVTVASSHC